MTDRITWAQYEARREEQRATPAHKALALFEAKNRVIAASVAEENRLRRAALLNRWSSQHAEELEAYKAQQAEMALYLEAIEECYDGDLTQLPERLAEVEQQFPQYGKIEIYPTH